MNKILKYDDVCLIPKFSSCQSRSECNTSTLFLDRTFRLPIMPSNMKAVIDRNWAYYLSQNDYLYSMHRFDIDIENFVRECNRDDWKLISISLGVKNYEDLIYGFHSSGLRVDIITIDIAHGHSESMRQAIFYIKENLPNVKIIAGNVATPEAVIDLHRWGADAVKVGIGQGSPCTTKNKTGFTMPMFSCVMNCANQYEQSDSFISTENLNKIPIIADGGVKYNGDIAKALVAGASFVMAGGIFAACIDSPAASIEVDGILQKVYYGSASFENKKIHKNIEGKLKKLSPNGMTLKEKLREMEEDLQSAISYAGGKDLSVFNKTAYSII